MVRLHLLNHDHSNSRIFYFCVEEIAEDRANAESQGKFNNTVEPAMSSFPLSWTSTHFPWIRQCYFNHFHSVNLNSPLFRTITFCLPWLCEIAVNVQQHSMRMNNKTCQGLKENLLTRESKLVRETCWPYTQGSKLVKGKLVDCTHEKVNLSR
jgi:hypothetical protein